MKQVVAGRLLSGLVVLGMSAISGFGQTVGSTFPRPVGSVIFDCTVDTNNTHGWIAPVVHFAYLASTNTVDVLDSHALHENGKPVVGTATTDESGRLVFAWRLKGETVKHDQVTVVYRAVKAKGSSDINIRSMIQGAENVDLAHGTCAQR